MLKIAAETIVSQVDSYARNPVNSVEFILHEMLQENPHLHDMLMEAGDAANAEGENGIGYVGIGALVYGIIRAQIQAEELA